MRKRVFKPSEEMIKNAVIIVELAELGDNRLLAADGPAGNQRPDLNLKEGLKFDRAAFDLARDILGSV